MNMPTWKHRSQTSVAQVWKGTVTTTTNGHTYVVALTDDDGGSAAVTYTVANPPDTTATLVATGFVNAWNASAHPLISRLTASQSGAQVILTADAPGVPFSAVASGTGTWSGTGNTTSSVGLGDYNTAINWSGDSVPVATDDVIIPAGTMDLQYGLNQSAVAIGEFLVESGHRAQIGRFDGGIPHYLRLDPDTFSFLGSGSLGLFDFGSAAIPLLIESRGAPAEAGRHVVYIKGSALTTVEINRGNVGIAPLFGETATIGTLICGFADNQANDVDLTVGGGVTLTTLNQTGGRCLLKCSATTVNQSSGCTLTTEGTGAIATLTARGAVYPKSTGTIGTLNCYGTVDFSRDFTARTVTTLVGFPGGKVILHAGVTIANVVLPDTPGTFTIVFV